MHELVFFTSCILTIPFVAKIMIELEFPLDDQSPKKAPTESSSSFLGRFKDIFVFSPSPDIRKSVFALDDIVYAGLRKIKRVAIGGPEGARCENFPRAKRCRPLYFSPTVIDGKPVRQVITRELEIGTECHVGSVGISDVFPLGDYDVTNQNLIKFDRHQHQIPQNYVSPLAYDIIIICDLQLDSSESGGCTRNEKSQRRYGIGPPIIIALMAVMIAGWGCWRIDRAPRHGFLGMLAIIFGGILIASSVVWFCIAFAESAAGFVGISGVSAPRYGGAENVKIVPIVVPELEFRDV